MNHFDEIKFHESSVAAFFKHGTSIYLDLDEVQLDGKRMSVRLDFKNVNSFLENGENIDNVEMPFPDGEVLTLIYIDNIVDLIVEWNDFASHESIVRSYRFFSESIATVLLPVD